LTQKAKADNQSAAGVATPEYKHSISIMVMYCRMLKQAVNGWHEFSMNFIATDVTLID
jgi:hypothetical protein